MIHVVTQIHHSMLELILLFLYEAFMFFHIHQILRFDQVILFSPFLKSYFSVSLSIKK